MKTVGIVAEYNPFHAGHRKQFDRVKAEFGGETAIVCAMSGNYVQRGAPAVMDKTLRAKAAVACGADLVVELPTTVSLSSAEGFAAGGVGILSKLCDALCFGAETGEAELLMETARALLSEDFSPLLRRELDGGKSFPAARADALSRMGLSGEILRRPNDILAVEYCKAILAQQSPMTPFPIRREGGYHDQTPDRENPSATAVRRLMLTGEPWDSFVPEPARAVLKTPPCTALPPENGRFSSGCAPWPTRNLKPCPTVGRVCGANSCTPAAGKPHWRTSSPVSNPSATPAPALTG